MSPASTHPSGTYPNNGGSGSYCAAFLVDGDAANDDACYVWKLPSSPSNLFIRAYHYLQTDGFGAGDSMSFFGVVNAAGNVCVQYSFRNVTLGAERHQFDWWDGAGLETDVTACSIDQWYLIELNYDNDNNRYDWKVDGSRVASGAIAGSMLTPASVFVGCYNSVGTWASQTLGYVDEVWVDDADWPGSVTAWTKTFSDGVSISDSFSRTVEFTRTYTEQVDISDTPALSMVKTVPGEVVNTSDAVSKEPGVKPAEIVNISDGITTKGITMTKADVVNISDSVAKAASMAKSDGVSISDSTGRAVSMVFSDAVNISETAFGYVYTGGAGDVWTGALKLMYNLLTWAGYTNIPQVSSTWTRSASARSTWTSV